MDKNNLSLKTYKTLLRDCLNQMIWQRLVYQISINETIIRKHQISYIILTDCETVTKRTEDGLIVVKPNGRRLSSRSVVSVKDTKIKIIYQHLWRKRSWIRWQLHSTCINGILHVLLSKWDYTSKSKNKNIWLNHNKVTFLPRC